MSSPWLGRQAAPPLHGVRRLGGRTARAAGKAVGALVNLARAELALARAALPRALLLTGLATLLLALSLPCLLALLALGLRALGLDWLAVAAASSGLLLAGAILLAVWARRTADLARFTATRRQLAALLGDRTCD